MDYLAVLEEIGTILEQSEGVFGSISSILNSVRIILTFIATGLSLLVSVVVVIVAIVQYIIQAIPVVILARKTGYKLWWVALIPFLSSYCRFFVLCEMAGDKPFDLQLEKPFGKLWRKLHFEDRRWAFFAHVIIKYFARIIVWVLSGVVSNVVPVVGLVALSINLVPPLACALIKYVFLRDVLDLFNANKKSNKNTALIIALLEILPTRGFIVTFYLYTLLGKKPLPVTDAAVTEPKVEELPAPTADGGN